MTLHTRTLSGVLGWALLLLVPAPAAADLPPPRGYVEQCTIEKQCQKGEEGDACGTWRGEPDKCKKKHAGDGFVYKCRTYGATTWTEVYCRAKKK